MAHPFNLEFRVDSCSSSSDKNNCIDCIEKLRSLLPVIDAVSDNMDRISILRMTRAYLGSRNIPNKPWPPEYYDPVLNRSLMLQAMDTFIFVLGEKGRILYATENVSTTFGYSQHIILGTDFFDIISGKSGRKLVELINMSLPAETCHKVSLKIKSKQCKRALGYATTVGDKTFKYAECQVFTQRGRQGVSISICGTVLDRNGYPDMSLNRSQMVIYTALDLKISFVPSCSPTILGHAWNDLHDVSFYQLIHPDDTTEVLKTHAKIKKHQNYEQEIPVLRLIKRDFTYAYASLYFLYRKDHVGRNGDTIKIIVTHYGDEDPKKSTGASSHGILRPTAKVPETPSAFHLVHPEVVSNPFHQACSNLMDYPLPFPFPQVSLSQRLPIMEMFLPPPTPLSFDFPPFLGIDQEHNQ